MQSHFSDFKFHTDWLFTLLPHHNLDTCFLKKNESFCVCGKSKHFLLKQFIALSKSLMTFEYCKICIQQHFITRKGCWSVYFLIRSHWIYFHANIRWREPSYWLTGWYCHNDLSRVDEVLGTSLGNMAAWLAIWQRGLLKLIDYLPNRMKTNGGGCITSRLIFSVTFFNWRCIAFALLISVS